jgi:hypothetical protein
VPCGKLENERAKVSSFATMAFGRVGEPDFTDDGVLQVACFDDLMATQVWVVLQRAEAKDCRDVAAMVNAGVSLPRGLASARVLFGPSFQPSESLKALVYFNDGDLKTLSAANPSAARLPWATDASVSHRLKPRALQRLQHFLHMRGVAGLQHQLHFHALR